MTLRLGRTLKWGLAVLVVAIVLLLATVLFASFWINRDAGKREIDAVLSRATGGAATYERIGLRFLPLPGASISQPRISVHGVVEIQARALTIRFDALALLTGRVRVRSAHLASPQALVQLPAGKADSKPFDLAGAEQQLRAVLAQIAQAAPSAAVTVNDGRVDIRIGEQTPLELREVDAQLDSNSGKLSVDLSCSSSLWEQLSLAATLSTTDLVGEGHAEISGLRAGDLGAALGFGSQWPVDEAIAEASGEWTMAGLQRVQGHLTLASPAVVVQLGEQRAPIDGLAAEASVDMSDALTRWTVRRLELDAPRLTASATLTQSGNATDLQLDVEDADIAALQAWGNRAGVPALARVPVRVEAGTVTTLSVRARASSLDRLFEVPNLEIQGAVEQVRLFLPDYALRLEEMRARGALSGGGWTLEQVEARVGKVSIRDGRLAGKLGVTPVPLHVEALASVDLAEALALAKRLVRNPQARADLASIRELQGTAQLRVVVGETLDRLEPELNITAIQMHGRYAAIPLPIRISSGQLSYTTRELRLDRVDGALGQSSFAGVTGRLQLAGSNRIEVQRADAELAVDELFRWLKSREDLASVLKPLRALSGAASVSLTQLTGNLRDADAWQFRASVRPRRLSIDAPDFAPPVSLDGGQILITQQDVQLQSVKVSTLDAVLTLSGRAQDYRKGALALQGKAGGVLGAQALHWVQRRAKLPREIHLEPPLAVDGVEASWTRGGAAAASGNIKFAGGAGIGFGVQHIGERVDVRNLTVRDAVSDATFSGSFSGARVQARFKGKLAASTVQRMFVDRRFDGVEVQGDLQAQGDLDAPLKASVVGSLRGSGVPIPADLPIPVTLERFSVSADRDTLKIESATLTSGEDRVDLSGQVTRAADGYVVDIDLRGDTLTIPDAVLEEGGRHAPGTPTSSKVLDRLAATRISGGVAVNLRRVRFGRFEIAPLIAVGRHSNRRADLQITQAALCGVSMQGAATLRPDGVSFQTTLAARNQPIGESIPCLTERHVRLTGNFDFDAQLSAQGEMRGIARALRGSYSIAARNGRILQFDTLDKVFEILNLTGVVAGRLPDLRQAGIGYTSAQAHGTIQGTKITADEFALNADNVTVAVQGSVDYATDRIDGTVLVAPLPTVNWIVSKIPILGKIFGTTVLAIPVQVSGTLNSPIVVPLGPEAIATRFAQMLSNTLELPVDFIKIIPAGDKRSGAAGASSP